MESWLDSMMIAMMMTRCGDTGVMTPAVMTTSIYTGVRCNTDYRPTAKHTSAKMRMVRPNVCVECMNVCVCVGLVAGICDRFDLRTARFWWLFASIKVFRGSSR